METLIEIVTHPYVGAYVYIAVFVWMLNSVLAGYHGTMTNKEDFFQSVLWPISISALIGSLIRLIVDTYRNRKTTTKGNVNAK